MKYTPAKVHLKMDVKRMCQVPKYFSKYVLKMQKNSPKIRFCDYKMEKKERKERKQVQVNLSNWLIYIDPGKN